MTTPINSGEASGLTKAQEDAYIQIGNDIADKIEAKWPHPTASATGQDAESATELLNRGEFRPSPAPDASREPGGEASTPAPLWIGGAAFAAPCVHNRFEDCIDCAHTQIYEQSEEIKKLQGDLETIENVRSTLRDREKKLTASRAERDRLKECYKDEEESRKLMQSEINRLHTENTALKARLEELATLRAQPVGRELVEAAEWIAEWGRYRETEENTAERGKAFGRMEALYQRASTAQQERQGDAK